MSNSSPGISRDPLWKKAVLAIREDIESGNWAETLPGEHQLAKHYEVGRRTIRDALSKLEEEGVIGTSPGKPRQILCKITGERVEPGYPDHVFLISPYAEEKGIAKSRIVFNRLFQALSQRGIHLIPRRVEAGSDKALNRTLGQLKKQFPRSVWLLHDCPGAVQRWCEKQGELALVLGAKDPSSSYASVDMDAGAVISQAVEHFESKGHKRSDLMFVMRHDPGKINQKAALLFKNIIGTEDEAQILQHDDANLIDQLRHRLSLSAPPTGLLCWRTHDAIRTVTFLTHQGVSIPSRLSIISCGSIPTMEFIHPEITRFLSPTAEYERCFIRLLNSLIKGDAQKNKDFRFIPEFLEGKTVAKPAEKRGK